MDVGCLRSKMYRLRKKGVDTLSYLNQELVSRMEKIESKKEELKKLASRLDEFEEVIKERRLTISEAYNKTSIQNRYGILVKECSDELDICKTYKRVIEYEMDPTRRKEGKCKSRSLKIS